MIKVKEKNLFFILLVLVMWYRICKNIENYLFILLILILKN